MPQHIRTSSRRFHWLWRYGFALIGVGIALALRLLLRPILADEAPFLLLFPAVLVAGAFGGLGPGLLATLLSGLVAGLFLTQPVSQLRMPDVKEWTRLMLFVLEGLFISVLGARLQAARRRAEESEAHNRMLEQRVLDISDAERQRIGQDLHDGLGQHLTGVAFLSKALQQRLASENRPEAADATKIASLVSESIGQTRALARGLAPVALDEGGLAGALSQLAVATQSVFAVKCSFRDCEDVEVPDLSQASHLYRIAQEAITNAIRHGNPRSIIVSLSRGAADLQLSIEDDGVGFTENDRQLGMGLQIMRFRARMLGGSLRVERLGVAGTRVTCIVPIARNSEIV